VLELVASSAIVSDVIYLYMIISTEGKKKGGGGLEKTFAYSRIEHRPPSAKAGILSVRWMT
jgi:hypothetical protein